MIPSLIYHVDIFGWNVTFLSALLVDIRELERFPPLDFIISITTVVEMVLLVFIGLAYLPYFYVVATCSVYHPNLKRIMLLLILNSFLFLFTRFVLILYSFRYIDRTGDETSDLLLLIAGTVRLACMIVVFAMFPFILTERIFAVIYLWDYEHKRRTWISSIIIVGSAIVAPIGAIGLSIAVLEIRAFATYFGIPAFLLAMIGFAWGTGKLSRVNQKTLDDLNRKNCEYGLSAKYQAAENQRCFGFANKFLYFSTFSDFFGTGVVIIHVLLYKQPTLNCLIAGAIFEHYSTLYPISYLFVSLYAVEEWRKKYFSIFEPILCGQKIGDTPPEKANINHDQDTKDYFDYYKSTWA
ncbi:unnamed protein product, partial [Mesorhabditis spiculigera]